MSPRLIVLLSAFVTVVLCIPVFFLLAWWLVRAEKAKPRMPAIWLAQFSIFPPTDPDREVEVLIARNHKRRRALYRPPKGWIDAESNCPLKGVVRGWRELPQSPADTVEPITKPTLTAIKGGRED